MRTAIIRTILFACALNTACAKSDDSVNQSVETKTETFSYEFEINGCKTGKQTFKSKADLCDGLQNNALNNYCAIEMRAEYYQANCRN